MSFSLLKKYLLDNCIVVYKSDTIPSIYARMCNYQVLKKIKKRSDKKPFLLLVGSFKILLRYVSTVNIKEIKKEILNTPISIIYKPNFYFLDKYQWPYGTVAFRIPKLAPLNRILCSINEPIISTSFEDFLKLNNELVFIEGWEENSSNKPSRIYNSITKEYIR